MERFVAYIWPSTRKLTKQLKEREKEIEELKREVEVVISANKELRLYEMESKRRLLNDGKAPLLQLMVKSSPQYLPLVRIVEEAVVIIESDIETLKQHM